MSVIDNIILGSQIKHDKFDRDIRHMKGSLGGFSQSFSGALLGSVAGAGIGAGIGLLQSGLSTITGLASSAGNQLVRLTSEAFTLADGIAASARQIGTSSSAWSELQHFATLSDVAVSDLESGIKKLNLSLVDAAQNGKSGAAKALRELGLSADELVTLSPDQALERISDGLAGVNNHAAKTALLGDLVGNKLGVKLVDALGQGSGAIRELREESKALGFSLSAEDEKRINLFNDMKDRLGTLGKGLGMQIASELGPPMAAVLEQIIELGKFGIQHFDFFAMILKGTARQMASLTDVVLQSINLQIRAFNALIDASSAVPRMLAKAAGLQNELNQFDLLRTSAEKATAVNVSAWLDGILARGDRLADSFVSNREAITDWADGFEQARGKADDFIADLERSIKQLQTGWTANEMKVHDLANALAGVDPAKVSRAAELVKELELLEQQKRVTDEMIAAQKKSHDEMVSAAKSIFDSTRTPLEKFEEQQRKIADLLAKGLIDQNTAARAELAGLRGLRPKQEMQFAAGHTFGTVAAVDAIIRGQARERGQRDPVAKNTADLLTEIKGLRQDMRKQPPIGTAVRI